MKSVIIIILGAGLVSILAGCSSTPVELAPVGPNPHGVGNAASNGQLEVFSRLVACTEAENPIWHQHSAYRIYDLEGRLVKYVGNTTGYYEEDPRVVALPPGQYRVSARASDYLRVEVPVTINPGHTTRIHLDGNWKLPNDAARQELVSLPDGNPVGWLEQDMKPAGSRSGATQ